MAHCNTTDCSGCSKKRTRDAKNEIIDNKVQNLSDLSREENVMDNQVEQILQNFGSQVTYVTGPQTTRQYMQINLASVNQKSEQELIEILSGNLQQANEDFIYYIAGFKCKNRTNPDPNDNKIIYRCDVSMFKIPKQLIANLVKENINKIYYLIGNWQQEDKFLVSTNNPDNSILAKLNFQGIEMPFQTCLLNLETM